MSYDKRITKQERNSIKSGRRQSKLVKSREAEKYLTAIKSQHEIERLGHQTR